jgi:hypothetical protein
MDGGQYGPSPNRWCASLLSLWHNGGMTSRLKRPRDLAQLAKLMIDIASGEVKDHESPQKKTTKRKLPSRRSSRTQTT